MKSLSIIISGGLFLTSLVFGQNAANTSRRIDSSKAVEPQALQVAKQNKSKKGGSKDLSESDTGAQRPILLKTKGISAFFGYDSKYYYQSNPLRLLVYSSLRLRLVYGETHSTGEQG